MKAKNQQHSLVSSGISLCAKFLNTIGVYSIKKKEESGASTFHPLTHVSLVNKLNMELISFEYSTQCRNCFVTDCVLCDASRTCLCSCNGTERIEENVA